MKKRWLAITLVVTLLGTSMPQSVYAKEISREEQTVEEGNEEITFEESTFEEGSIEESSIENSSEESDSKEEAGVSSKNEMTDDKDYLNSSVDEEKLDENIKEFDGLINLMRLGNDLNEAVEKNSNIVKSGQCGDNSYWKLDKEGTLTVYGEGTISGFIHVDSRWKPCTMWSKDDNIVTLVIEEGITNVPSAYFERISSLKKVVLPQSIKKIEKEAFYYCSSIEGKLDIPNSVETIGDRAFEGCSGFTGDLIIPDSVKSIGCRAFVSCSGLTGDLIIPDSVESIGDQSFAECSGFTGKLKISNSVERISSSAFSGCRGLTGDLIIPDSVKIIEHGAFENCSGFTGKLKIPNATEIIRRGAFENCSGFTGDLIIPDSVKTIEYESFANCSGFTGNLKLSNSTETIGERAFYNCKNFTGSLIIPNSVITIKRDAFVCCSGFNGELVIPETVKTIEGGAFIGCSGFTGELIIPNTIKSIEGSTFCGCKGFSGKLVIPDSVESIGVRAFENCRGFTGDLVIPDSVKSIGGSAFEYCTGFNGKLKISNSVTEIEDSTFENCGALTGELIIPNSVKTIGKRAFMDCSRLTGKLVIPKSVKTIGEAAFYRCYGFKGVLDIPSSVTVLESGVFAYCEGLSGDLIIPNSVTIIGNEAFGGCKGFSGKLVIPDSVESIGNRAFEHCSGFTGDLIIPDSVKSIGDSAFEKCFGFNGILKLSDSLESIEKETFYYCSGFTGDLVIPDSVKTIGVSAFEDCIGFNGVLKIPNSIKIIEKYVFSSCSGFTGDLIIPDSVEEIELGAFEWCSGLKGELKLPNSVKKISYDAFYGCKFTGELKLPNSLSSFYLHSFGGCNFEPTFYVPDSVIQISFFAVFDFMFSDYYIPQSVQEIDDYDSYLVTKTETIFHCVKDSYAYNWAKQNGLKVVEWDGKYPNESTNGDIAGYKVEVYVDGRDINQLTYKKWYSIDNPLAEELSQTFMSEIYCLPYNELPNKYLRITPNSNEGIASYKLYENNKLIYESSNGLFKIIPEDFSIVKDNKVPKKEVRIIDSQGKVQDTIDISKLFKLIGFKVTVHGTDKETITSIQEVKLLDEIVLPTMKEKDDKGRRFSGWYENPNPLYLKAKFDKADDYYHFSFRDSFDLYPYYLSFSRDYGWSFTNSDEVFKGKVAEKGYDILDKDKELLLRDCSSVQRFTYSLRLKEEWGGSCYGMSLASVLCAWGKMSVSDYRSDCSVPADVKELKENKLLNDPEELESMINYMHISQNTYADKGYWSSKFAPTYDYLIRGDNQIDVILELEQKLSEGMNGPFLLDLVLLKKIVGYELHSVVSYNWEKTSDGYQCKIYDPNYGANCSFTFKFKIEDEKVTIDKEEYWGSSYKGVYISCIRSMDELMNYAAVKRYLERTGVDSSLKEASYSNSLYIQSSTPDLVVTDGSKSATISGGKKIAGDLPVDTYLNIPMCYSSEDSNYTYIYELSPLPEGRKYTVTPVSKKDKEVQISIISDIENDSYAVDINTKNLSNIVIAENAKVNIQSENKEEYDVLIMSDDESEIRNINISATTSTFDIDCSDGCMVNVDENGKVDIEIDDCINDISFDNISVGKDGISIQEGKADKINIVDVSTQKVVSSKVFGHYIVFDSMHGSAVDSLYNVTTNSKIVEPSEPIKVGYKFTGWYKDTEYTQQWDFDKDIVTEDTVLYAKWKINPEAYVSVRFVFENNTLGSITTLKDTAISQKNCLTKDGFNLSWYKDEQFTLPWDFEKDVVTENITLYAREKTTKVTDEVEDEPIIEVEPEIPSDPVVYIPTYRVVYLNDDDTFYQIDEYKKGDKIITPANPTKAKQGKNTYEFAGWEVVSGAKEITATQDSILRATYKTLIVCGDNHAYGSPKFTWATGYKTCKAEFTCSDCGKKKTVDCKVATKTVDSTTEKEGSITYTATVTENGKTYTSTRKTVIAKKTNVYKVIYLQDDGSVYKSYEYKKGEKIIQPADPTKKPSGNNKYKFMGWKCIKGAKETTATQDSTFKATYMVINCKEGQHDYVGKSVNWNGGNTLKATFVCAECGKTAVVDCTLTYKCVPPTATADGKLILTATATYQGISYKESYTYVIPRNK